MTHETTYAELVQDLQDWVEDDDNEFVGSIDKVISLGELRCLKDLDLGIFNTEDATAVTANTVVTVTKPLPTESIISWQSIYYDNAGKRTWLQLRSYDWIRDHQTPGSTASPLYYSELNETQWLLSPIPDAIYTLNARGISYPEGLSITNTTTWLGNNVPDLLFKACLAESEGFLKSDDRIETWSGQYVAMLPIVKRQVYEQRGQHYDLTPLEVPASPINASNNQR